MWNCLIYNSSSETNDKTNFPHNLSLTDTQVLRLPKAFANDFSANIKFSKNQLRKMVQLDGVISDLLNFDVDHLNKKSDKNIEILVPTYI